MGMVSFGVVLESNFRKSVSGFLSEIA